MERFFHFKEAGHAIHFNVVDVAHGFFLDFFHHKVNEGFLAPLAFSVGFFCMTEAAGKDKGGFMFFWAQVDVAGTFGKAVFFADNGHEAQGDVHEEIFNHALQDLGLLSVFEAVVGAVTLGEVKELGTDRSDAAKMNRSCLPQRTFVIGPVTSTQVISSWGYISPGAGAKTRSAPSRSAILQSLSKVLGYAA